MLHAPLPGVQTAAANSYSRAGGCLWPDRASSVAGPLGRPRSHSPSSLAQSSGRLQHRLTALPKVSKDFVLDAEPC